MDLKLLKTYFLLVSLFAFICFLFSYFTDQNYAINFLSFAQGNFIFLFINILYYLLQRRYRSSKLTPSFVLYEVIYAFVLKISLLIFLLLFTFKILNLNNKIVVFVFSILVLSRFIVNFIEQINGKNYHKMWHFYTFSYWLWLLIVVFYYMIVLG